MPKTLRELYLEAHPPQAVTPPEPSLLTYRTPNIHFSVWVICENLLPYDHCRLIGREVLFFFRDTEGRGGELMSQWLRTDPLLPQKTAAEVLRNLRTEMNAVKEGAGNAANL